MPTRSSQRVKPAHSPDIPRSRFQDLNHLPQAFDLGGFAVQTIYCGFYPLAWWRNYLHSHSFFEVCYTYAGRGTFTIYDATHQIGPGEAFLARPADPHEIISSRQTPMGIYFWAFSMTAIASSGAGAAALAAQRLLESFASAKSMITERTAGMAETIEALTREVVSQEPGYTQVIHALWSKLVLDTARAFVDRPLPGEPLPEPAADPAAATVRRACRYLGDNFARSITVRDVAEQVNLGDRQLGRLFRKVLGVSVMEQLSKVRLEAARRKLLDPNTPIKQVARDCGYASVHHFTTLFHTRCGLTPAQFRLRGRTA